MKTLSGKEFRKLFNRYETGFYLSEFEYLKDFDPLFPECVGGNDSNLLIVFYVQIMPDDFVMQLHRF
ncbi:hypothetical protein SK87_00025 [Escherichia coli]|nr:hypothetical protein SK87_00025 [Escherichia coli]